MTERTRGLALVAAAALALIAATALAPAVPPRRILCGYYDAKPSCYRGEQGRPQGIFVETLGAIAAREGWRVEYEYRSWDGLLAALRDGSLDLVPAIVRTERREDFAVFTKGSVMTDWGVVYAKAGREPGSILELDGRAVGALANDYWFSGPGSLQGLCASFGIRPEYRYYPDYSSLFDALGRGELYAAAGSNSLGIIWIPQKPIVATSILYNPIELRFACPRTKDGEALAAAIDGSLSYFRSRSPETLSSILERYQVPARRDFRTPPWLFYLLVAVSAFLLAAVALLVASRQALKDREKRRYSLFDDSPVAMYEEDFSALKRLVEQARAEGREDWEALFAPDDFLRECVGLVKVLDANREMVKLLGFQTKAEVIRGLIEVLPGTDLEPLRREFVAFASGSTSIEGETAFAAGTAREKTVQYKASIVPGYERSWSRVLVTVVDLSERKKAEEAIERSLAEKELLLHEIHHRVKNNLQIICSMINLQLGSRDRSLPESQNLLEMENRVRAMALVHEELLRSSDVAAVDFAAYAVSLSEHLFDAYGVDPRKIRLEASMDDLRFPLGVAITCGLIINELVVNSLKYAFPGDRRGSIKLTLSSEPEGGALLEVSDDGVGSPREPAELEAAGSLGLSLVRTLSSQLRGSCEIHGSKGFAVRVRIPPQA